MSTQAMTRPATNYVVRDSVTMLRRNLLHWIRYPSLAIMLVAQPIAFLLLFVFVFGGTLGAGLPGVPGGGDRGDYLEFITPGILVMAVASVALGTAIEVALDMTGGIIARFRTMDIAKVSVLTGHVLGAVFKTLFAVAVTLAFAVLIGYRSDAGLLDWLIAFALLIVMAFALTWLTVGMGLAADSVETASNTPLFLIMLPFLSSAFVPTEEMPAGLRQFAEHQPFTPMIDSLRALTTGVDPGWDLWLALGWCAADRGARLPVVTPAVHEGPDEVEGHWIMLTIGQLAAHAGVTVRAVRHYHARGLLPEPERDASGYRRYDANAVVNLIRIRTLADAGVPLSRVKELLEADEEEFAAAVAEIDKRLRAEIREQQKRRERINRLAAGDSLALPSDAVAYLDQLRELGVPERMVEGERDAWILIAAQAPERMTKWIALKREQLEDPEVVELYRRLFDMIDWQPDDPRLPEVADWLAAAFAKAESWEEYDADDELAAGSVELLDSMFVDSVPAARRLMELLEERGWSGWTQLEQTKVDSHA